MTDEEIKALAEKTREEKYCKKYIYKERGKQYCSLDCVFSDGNYGCRPQEYYTSFLDGFKAGYKIGFDEGHDEGFMEARLGGRLVKSKKKL